MAILNADTLVDERAVVRAGLKARRGIRGTRRRTLRPKPVPS
jgi:hypothetical protein